MRVESSRRIAGKMFATAQDASCTQAIVESPGLFVDLGHGPTVTAPFQGIIRLVVERDVQDGAQIEIEAE